MLKINKESLAERCEICHQSDLFNARTNQCSRCNNALLQRTYLNRILPPFFRPSRYTGFIIKETNNGLTIRFDQQSTSATSVVFVATAIFLAYQAFSYAFSYGFTLLSIAILVSLIATTISLMVEYYNCKTIRIDSTHIGFHKGLAGINKANIYQVEIKDVEKWYFTEITKANGLKYQLFFVRTRDGNSIKLFEISCMEQTISLLLDRFKSKFGIEFVLEQDPPKLKPIAPF